ncbi:hypothetical protein J6590_064457 [Homalodisca vitripennis]|nr:hypothetical protein J6590_064457 [Homalodisca vitripennis]
MSVFSKVHPCQSSQVMSSWKGSVYPTDGPGHDTSGERRATSVERHSSVTRAARVVTIQAARVCCNMPSSEDLVHLLLLSENSMLKRRVVRGCKRGIKRWGVHPINTRRRVYGEYHHLIKQLKENPERFF